ncbi:MAG: glycosyl transferase [Candidatus Gottesmanbacteria bacterium GW2011_GWA2_43_14]|uniref:Glycosyl transferase n=1 Tax=Candidatus Gottesmanbacteria bacterium GW2011_GWA2_43_14 TaxID=1618443 RepID=A0A0G1GAT7_9BACT|nr:MAG: glycosyl transferase [Candidatus Gottesmanbacteria bacterium GW2011_GWA2_43_14]
MTLERFKFSVIIPFKSINPYVQQCLNHLKKQSYQNFEIILLPDKKEKIIYKNVISLATGSIGPAEKRDLGAKKARGEILAFIDDDAYPHRDWLKNSLSTLKNKNVAAVCGPGVTPREDDIFRQAGGWVNSLWFGSGGAGTYRFIPQKERSVDDYPSMNFIVRKVDFDKVGGFNTHYWPGEDTKLCLDLVYNLKKKIIYQPKVLVYHHRKPLFLPHLKQVSRFAIHRGYFARVFPQTSLRFGYLIPTLFVLFLIVGFFLSLFFKSLSPLYLISIGAYLSVLTINMVYVMVKSRNILTGVLTGTGIFLTHIFYGILFPLGFLKKNLKQ